MTHFGLAGLGTRVGDVRSGDEGIEVRKGGGAEEGGVGDDAVVAAEVREAPNRRDEGRAVEGAECGVLAIRDEEEKWVAYRTVNAHPYARPAPRLYRTVRSQI